MKLSKRVVVWAYRASPSRFTWNAGAEHESDPDVFTLWVYLGFFGLAWSWSRDGWLHPNEATRERALHILAQAPDPQAPPAVFADEWDRLDREGR